MKWCINNRSSGQKENEAKERGRCGPQRRHTFELELLILCSDSWWCILFKVKEHVELDHMMMQSKCCWKIRFSVVFHRSCSGFGNLALLHVSFVSNPSMILFVTITTGDHASIPRWANHCSYHDVFSKSPPPDIVLYTRRYRRDSIVWMAARAYVALLSYA